MHFSAWLLTILLLFVGAALAGLAGFRMAGANWGIRWGLLAIAGGLIPYNYMALGLPGGADFATANGMGGIIVLATMGMLAGWGAGWLWWRQKSRTPTQTRG
jgi:hypothetical protein